jgi:hypothetical protein
MLETAIALALGHLLADFVLQTDAMVRSKAQPAWMLGHVGVVAAASWAALGLAPAPALIALIAASHFAIDWLKLLHGGQGFAPFAIDQAAHAGAIALGSALWPEAWGAGLWGLAAVPAWLPEAMAMAAGAIAAVPAGGYAVQTMMQGLALSADPTADDSLPQGGRLIGRLERAMILMLVLAGQPDGIGLLIAAKSLLRFNELAREQDRRASEYVIIGTLASFAWGLGTAFAAEAALRALGP